MEWIKANIKELVTGLLLGVSLGGNLYFYLVTEDLKTAQNELFTVRDALNIELASSTATLAEATGTIALMQERIDNLEEDKDDLRDDLRDEKNKNDSFEDQISKIAGTVGTLDKLSKTDEELLQKYSKVYFLNENYIPSDLKAIRDKYILAGRQPQFFHGDAISFLEDMINDAVDDGIELLVASAYRSFETQTELKGQYSQTYGTGANAFSADQGYSEHQLGTTVDLTTDVIGGAYSSFANTTAYEWLLKNAHKYGFTLSYPENNTFYVFEPWHWRFVGTELANDLRRADAHFYDWEQRKIDEYLVNIFD